MTVLKLSYMRHMKYVPKAQVVVSQFLNPSVLNLAVKFLIFKRLFVIYIIYIFLLHYQNRNSIYVTLKASANNDSFETQLYETYKICVINDTYITHL